MKKVFFANAVVIAVSTFGAIQAASADVSVSANAGLTTDYKFRGVSQTNSGPAFQGGFDAKFDNGFYLKNWNSNVNYGAGNSGLEMDLSGGYGGAFSGALKDVTYNVGGLYYYYEGAPSTHPRPDTFEVYGSLGYAGFTAGLAVSAGKDYFALQSTNNGLASGAQGANTDLGNSMYFNLNYDYPLTEKMGLTLHYGLTNYDKSVTNGTAVIDKYSDYSIGVQYTEGKYNFGASVVATDSKAKSFFGKDSTEPSLILTVGTSF